MKKTNIIFVFSDQQRWDSLGCYGQKLPVTPNLDRLAAEGVRFENTFTCQPVCGPARAALQVGKWASQTGCFRNDIALPEHERTMANYLSEAGYETGYVGKWHLASTGEKQNYKIKPVPQNLRGGYRDFWIASDVLEFTSHSYDGHMFDEKGDRREFTAGRYRPDFLTDCALEFVNRSHEKPFFLFLSYIEPHHQNDHNCFEGPRGIRERFEQYETPGDLSGTQGDWRESYPDYLSCCWSLDQNVGRLREALEKSGEWDNTLFIYTSDHGCHFRTRNVEYRRSCHDASLRIPLIIHGPGFRGGQVERNLISLLDLTPTVLEAGGVAAAPFMVGRALQSSGSCGSREWRNEVYAEISEDHIGRVIRTGKWKYSIWVPSEKSWTSGSAASGSDKYYEECLYDLESDPHERTNLIREPALINIRSELSELLISHMLNAGEERPLILPAA
ncbi:MAG: sulfatase-like hydrolase/transferase [Victivallales bacterium]|jgi:uncharacterized sulfatase